MILQLITLQKVAKTLWQRESATLLCGVRFAQFCTVLKLMDDKHRPMLKKNGPINMSIRLVQITWMEGSVIMQAWITGITTLWRENSSSSCVLIYKTCITIISRWKWSSLFVLELKYSLEHVWSINLHIRWFQLSSPLMLTVSTYARSVSQHDWPITNLSIIHVCNTLHLQNHFSTLQCNCLDVQGGCYSILAKCISKNSPFPSPVFMIITFFFSLVLAYQAKILNTDI